jgi:ABC-type lipopolysaccharide export system ATPase subunit
MSDAMIVVENLSKHFNGTQVLKGIDLRVEAGEVVAQDHLPALPQPAGRAQRREYQSWRHKHR